MLSNRYGAQTLDYHKITSANLTFRNGGQDDLTFTCSESWNTSTPQFVYLDYVEIMWDVTTAFFGIVTRVQRSGSANDSKITYTVENVYSLWERSPWAQNWTLDISTYSGQKTFARNLIYFNGSQSLTELLGIIVGFRGLAASGTFSVPVVIPAEQRINNGTVLDGVKALLSYLPRAFSWFTYPDAGLAKYNVIMPSSFSSSLYRKQIADADVINISYEQQDFNTCTGVKLDYVTPWKLIFGDVASSGAHERQPSYTSEREAWWGDELVGGLPGDLNFVHREYSPRSDVYVCDWYVKTTTVPMSTILANGTYGTNGAQRGVFWASCGESEPAGGWAAQTYSNGTIALDSVINGSNISSITGYYPCIWGGPPSEFFAPGTESFITDAPRVVRARVSQTVTYSGVSRTYTASVYLIDFAYSNGKSLIRQIQHNFVSNYGAAQIVFDAKKVPCVTGSLTCRRSWTSGFNGFGSIRFQNYLSGATLNGVQQVSYDLNTDIVNITFGETSTLSPDDVIRTMRAARTT